MFDLLIKNGVIVDGSGRQAFPGSVGILGGKITAVIPEKEDSLKGVRAERVIDVKGKYVTPGFIDIHRHADAAVFREGFGELELRQGLTTIVNGNCGLSVVPCPKERRQEILGFLAPIVGNMPAGVPLHSFRSYINAVKEQKLPLNVGMLIGNGTVRAAAAGYRSGSLTDGEMRQVHRYLEAALSDGALGVSLGIVYAPEYNYSTEEFKKVLEPMRNSGVQLFTHIRGEGDNFHASLREVVEIARYLEVPLHVSHLKCVGQRNWGHGIAKALDILDEARESGLAVSCDVYPYTAGSTQLIQILPPAYLEGGVPGILKRLTDPAMREKLTDILQKPGVDFENLVNLVGWENIRMTTLNREHNREYSGKSVAEIARLKGMDPYACAYDMLVEENCEISMVDFIASEDDVRKVMRYPYSNIISDSVYPAGGIPHPRLYGTFPRVLEKYVKEEKVLDLETAVKKMTSVPAAVCKLTTKGLIREGMDADLVVFDLERIHTGADYDQPKKPGEGFSYVFVNGEPAVVRDQIQKQSSGRVLLNGESAR